MSITIFRVRARAFFVSQLLLAVLLLAIPFPPIPATSAHSALPRNDALVRRVRGELRVFTDWLEREGVKGFIGEVGWPGARPGRRTRWDELAEVWYGDADRARLPVTAWATGEWWPPDYRLLAYRARHGGGPIAVARSQARVIERHLTAARGRRGVNVAGGEFGAPQIEPTSSFSNERPGTYDVDYHYDSRPSFEFLARRGVRLVRIPFRWERLQPSLGGPLDATELERLKAVVRRARGAGVRVVLDMHNFGGYYMGVDGEGRRAAIGSEMLPVELFADSWRRISEAFSATRGLAAYGLMNEPVRMSADLTSGARMWEGASQAALDAIRANGDRKLVLVAGYEWSGVQSWSTIHPRSWIDDPVGKFRYEAHHYWDRDHSGTYLYSYRSERRHAASAP